ncbi:MAG: sigma-70 family RNA polymerase sigma factor [Bacteroidales bacterium]|nr:sigma-70 family RNA polymerase sigma factor [Bacteroidales bacterium]
MNIQYKELSDRQNIDLALSGNDEAMLFLIFDRYSPLLKKLCRRYYDNLYYLEQLQKELLIHLKSDDWRAVRNFGWRSSFGTWLGTVAGNLFIKKMPELIGIDKFSVSIGNDGSEGERDIPAPELPHENDMRMTMLIEAIQRLEDKDQRFILLREFDGYSPQEIAAQLETYRRKENRIKTREVDGHIEEIIPSAEYVHMLKGRAKDNIRVIVNELRKEYEW